MTNLSSDIQKAIAIAIVALVPTAYIVFLDGKCGKVTSPWINIEECAVLDIPADKL